MSKGQGPARGEYWLGTTEGGASTRDKGDAGVLRVQTELGEFGGGASEPDVRGQRRGGRAVLGGGSRRVGWGSALTKRGQTRGVGGVEEVHGAIAVEVRSPIVGVDQHRPRGHCGHIRHRPDNLSPRKCRRVRRRPITGTRTSLSAPWLQRLGGRVASEAEAFAHRRPIRGSRVRLADVKASCLVSTLCTRQAV